MISAQPHRLVVIVREGGRPLTDGEIADWLAEVVTEARSIEVRGLAALLGLQLLLDVGILGAEARLRFSVPAVDGGPPVLLDLPFGVFDPLRLQSTSAGARTRIRELLRVAIRMMWNHELDEGFVLDGEPMFSDPARGH